MNDGPVRYAVAGGVGRITLDAPENRNALSRALVTGLRQSLHAALADDRVRVIVLTGTGNTFCAGADLKEQRAANAAGQSDAIAESARRTAAIFQTMWHSPKPVVGRINGHARAGGLGLVGSCDIAVAAEQATFGYSEVRLGLAPALISVVTLPKIGVAKGMELFLTGENFDAEEARRLGLVNAVVAIDLLDAAVDRYVGMLLKGGPNALAACKKLVRDVPAMTQDEAFAMALELNPRMFASAEGLEGMTAFAERRPPRWAEGL
jgi:methylglutaconyl-CoA hydratase